MFAPAKTPKAIVERLKREMNAVLHGKAVEKKFEDQGAEIETGTPEQLKTLVQKEVAHWKSVVTAAKITVEDTYEDRPREHHELAGLDRTHRDQSRCSHGRTVRGTGGYA